MCSLLTITPHGGRPERSTGDFRMNPFKAFVIDQDENRKVVSRMGTLAPEQLNAGEVTIRFGSLDQLDGVLGRLR